MADHVLIDRAVVQQALEALAVATNCLDGYYIPRGKPTLPEIEDAITALRAALAQAEPVQELVQESALQAVAEKIGDQCAVWYGIGARDVEAVLREAARYGLVRAAQAEPVQEQTRSQKLAAAGHVRRPSLWALQAREALELIAAPQRPDGTWNRDREACRQLAAETLGRYNDD